MIGYIKGTVVANEDRELTVLTEGGVGYVVGVTPTLNVKYPEGEAVSLFVQTFVREDAIDLYGFERIEEKHLFNLLCEVNKIGPKTALSILAFAPIEEIVSAIISANSQFFKKISGVGAKTAEKIIIDLKDKTDKFSAIQGSVPADAPALANDRQTKEAAEALTALGYNPLQIRHALAKVADKESKNAGNIVREALKIIRNS
ncbi:Holliday junction branch migration protein RuvA [bacterium]|nr:Holliday junction branch migration protein RuvA [bacterium]